MTTSLIRLQNGCFKNGNDLVIPAVGKMSTTNGFQYFTKPGGLDSTNGLNIFNTDPKTGNPLGNTITKVELTPATTTIDAFVCPTATEDPQGLGKPIKKPIVITNAPDGTLGTCSSTETGTGPGASNSNVAACTIPGGRSCDLTITNGENNNKPIIIAADYWQAYFEDGSLTDFECKDITASSTYNTNYDTKQSGAFQLNQSDILVLHLGCGKCGTDEVVKVKGFEQIGAVDLVPGGLDIAGCFTNPEFGYCNLLPVENAFF